MTSASGHLSIDNADRRRAGLCLIGTLLLATSRTAVADDAALARCRAEAAAAQRLACYDAIPLRPAATAAGSVAAPAAAAPAPAGQAAANQFGLPSTEAALGAIESSLTGKVEGWGPRTQFRLANGQVWAIDDASSADLFLQDPKVRIRRGFGGAFYLELDGTNRSPRVRRVR